MKLSFKKLHNQMTKLVRKALDSGYSAGEVKASAEMAINLYGLKTKRARPLTAIIKK
jgi:hypothetical protein